MRTLFILAALASLVGNLAAKNAISDLTASVVKDANVIKVGYTLSIESGVSAYVSLQASKDGGKTFEPVESEAIWPGSSSGQGIRPGKNKRIVWAPSLMGWDTPLSEIRIRVAANLEDRSKVTPEFIRIPAGEFMQGESPPRISLAELQRNVSESAIPPSRIKPVAVPKPAPAHGEPSARSQRSTLAEFQRNVSDSTVPRNHKRLPAVVAKPEPIVMGEPQRMVRLTRAFEIQQTEVTFGQWQEVRKWAMENGYTDLAPGRCGSDAQGRHSDTHPVTMISWHDAVKWLNAWSEKEGKIPVYRRMQGDAIRAGAEEVFVNQTANGYRLPSEAEWEYACRAGTTSAFYNGDMSGKPTDPNLDVIAWYRGNSYNRVTQAHGTWPIATKEPNSWGLYDMAGNVSEWVWDGYSPYLGSRVDPVQNASDRGRVFRGGSWSVNAFQCRSALRSSNLPSFRKDDLGFRAARNVSASEMSDQK